MGCNPSKDGGDAPGLVDKATGGAAAANKILSAANDKNAKAETLLIPLCDVGKYNANCRGGNK